MKETTATAMFKLSSAIKEDIRFLELEKIEKKLFENSEVIEASKKMNDLESAYEVACKSFGEGSGEAKSALKNLASSKMELDSLPICLEYSLALAKINDVLRQIELIINEGLLLKKVSCK